MILGFLAEEGIEVETVRNNTGPGAWLTGSEPNWTPVDVMVPAADLPKARAALGETIEEPPAPLPPHPMADRTDTRRKVLWVVALVVLIAMLWGLLVDFDYIY